MSNVKMTVPTVGESITEVTISQWMKNEGDFVEMDEIICEIESDKASFEVTAEVSGILHPKAEEGDTLEIGALMCEIEPSEAGAASAKTSTPAPAAETKVEASTSAAATPTSTGQVVEMKVPTVGESITEVTIGSWDKENGDIVAMDELLCEIESDKASFELMAEAAGKLQIVAEEGATLAIGDVICKIEVMEGVEAGASSTPAATQTATAETSTTSAPSHSDANISPVAANILAEKGIDPATVKGTGPGGRIMKEDAMAAQKTSAPAAATPAASEPAAAAPTGDRNTEVKKMSSIRKTIARRLVAVKNETAMLTTFNEVDMKPIMDIRKKYKEQFKDKYEIGLGFMSFFTKAVCEALKEWPAVGAQIDGNNIIYHDYCDISIAVSSPRGLVVPVVRNAEKMSFAEIEKEIKRLALKARDGKLTIPEMEGGTFTITNGGIFGSMLSTPIINAPQAAILGMHNIVERPVAINGQVEIRPIMYVALSYDHRIIDGRESVSFLYMLKELLEDPTRLLLGV